MVGWIFPLRIIGFENVLNVIERLNQYGRFYVLDSYPTTQNKIDLANNECEPIKKPRRKGVAALFCLADEINVV